MAAHSMVELLAKKDKKVKKPWPWPDNYTLKLEEFITGIINKESAAIYSGGESITFPNGLILKFGDNEASPGVQSSKTITFTDAFPTGILYASITLFTTTDATNVVSSPFLKSWSTTNIVIHRHNGTGFSFNWLAIGH